MIVLGLDPGTRVTGYGVIHWGDGTPRLLTVGVIRLGSGEELALRLLKLQEELSKIFINYEPNWVVIEKIFLGANVDSAFKLGHARGICLAAAARSHVSFLELSPRSVKKKMTGSGAASKEELRYMLKQWLGVNLENFPLDASDALSLALVGGMELDVRDKLARAKALEVLR